MSRTRLNVFLEFEHAKRLDELAAMKGISKSSIVAAALASFLSPDGGDRREAAIAHRLDQLTRQFDKLERDQNILIETPIGDKQCLHNGCQRKQPFLLRILC